MEHINVVKYFAKYPLKAGVMKNFKRSDDKITGYQDLYNYCNTLTIHSLLADITDYIISHGENELREKIKNIAGYFLLLETGGISGGELNQARVRDSLYSIQLTIGYHNDYRSLDDMASALISDKCLDMANQLITYMGTDDKNLCPISRWLDNPFHLDPIEPALLDQSLGWQLTLSRNYNNLL